MMPKSVRGVMKEFKQGKLHSGSATGKVVTKRKQAIAIALSEQRQRGGIILPGQTRRRR
jgi:Flp pilus assembly protein CpaB